MTLKPKKGESLEAFRKRTQAVTDALWREAQPKPKPTPSDPAQKWQVEELAAELRRSQSLVSALERRIGDLESEVHALNNQPGIAEVVAAVQDGERRIQKILKSADVVTLQALRAEIGSVQNIREQFELLTGLAPQSFDPSNPKRYLADGWRPSTIKPSKETH
jgi:polyhydroxyalkanoate synthesis regulator phasin